MIISAEMFQLFIITIIREIFDKKEALDAKTHRRQLHLALRTVKLLSYEMLKLSILNPYPANV
jgi:hypothetical protein